MGCLCSQKPWPNVGQSVLGCQKLIELGRLGRLDTSSSFAVSAARSNVRRSFSAFAAARTSRMRLFLRRTTLGRRDELLWSVATPYASFAARGARSQRLKPDIAKAYKLYQGKEAHCFFLFSLFFSSRARHFADEGVQSVKQNFSSIHSLASE